MRRFSLQELNLSPRQNGSGLSIRTKPLIVCAIVCAAITVIGALVPTAKVRCLLLKSNLEEALGMEQSSIDDMKEALEADPGNTEALKDLGCALEKRGENEEAITCFQKLYEGPASRAWVAPHLINLDITEKKFSDCLKYAQEWTALEPENANAWRAQGKALAKLGKHDAALTCLNRSLKIDPSSGAALERDELIEHSRTIETAFNGMMNPGLEKKPFDWKALLRDAQRSYMSENREASIRMCNASLKLHPSFLAYLLRGRCKYILKDYNGSASDYALAEKLYTRTPRDWAGMMDDFKVITQSHRNFSVFGSGGFHFAYALTLMKLHRDKDAIAHLNAAEKEHMNRPALFQARAEVYRRLGDRAAVARDLLKARQTPQYVPNDVRETLESTVLPHE